MSGSGEAALAAGASPGPGRRRAGRPLVMLAVYLAVAWGVVAALLAGVLPGSGWVVAGLAAYTTVPLGVFLRNGGWPFYPGAGFRLFVLRPFWYVQLTLPLVAGAGTLGMLVGFPLGHGADLARWGAGVVSAGLGTLLLLGYAGSRQLVVREVTVTLPELPPAFDGLRVAQLSDLHIGPHIPGRFLGRVRRTVEALAADLIVITGDLIDDRPEDVEVFAGALGTLNAPLGVFLIPGNHDIYAGWTDVARRLRTLVPAELLVNEARILSRGGDRITLVGTGDPAGGRGPAGPDLPQALSGIPEGNVVIALAHNPALWPALRTMGVALTLSGHTHWGQFALPRFGWSLATPFLPHAMGAHAEDGGMLYIHPGTGYWGIPFRIGAAPEVAVITLRRGPHAGIGTDEARPADTTAREEPGTRPASGVR